MKHLLEFFKSTFPLDGPLFKTFYKRKTIGIVNSALLLILCFGSSARAQKPPPEKIISVNQSGYNLGWPKRFTAPTIANGTVFYITEKNSDKSLFINIINNGIGDFTSFNPEGGIAEYVVKVTDKHKTIYSSFPFSINKYWLENAFAQPALDFMIDNRSVIGTHPSAYGGAPWRDGTFYSYEVPSMVLQYLSNPNFYESAPVQIDYIADKRKILAADFKYVMETEGQNALQASKDYYQKIDAPIGDKIPDIIQNIHWGIGYYLVNPVTQDPSGGDEGRRLHPQTLEQFAYFLYGYPQYKKYFTSNFYKQAKKFACEQWEYTGLLGVFKTVGIAKGREAPGHSIMPNLFMYEVAKRDGDADANKYFKAAYEQTNWIIKNLDWKDPKTTKGQRMSEHVLIPALVYFLQSYTDQAPKGIKDKILQWADVAISRSNNLWDFRRYDLDSNWSVPEYSETGNIAGFSGIALSAASVLDNEQQKKRLVEIAVASIDDLFGRNPQNACSAYHQDKGFTNLEKGWPKAYKDDVCARLELVRGTFSSISNTAMYPYQPDGKLGHLEGWSAFNAAWNKSLAYLNYYDTRLELMDKNYTTVQKNFTGGDLFIQVETPTGTNAKKPQQITVSFIQNGTTTLLKLDETGTGTQIYRGTLKKRDIKKSQQFIIAYGNTPFVKTLVLDKGKVI